MNYTAVEDKINLKIEKLRSTKDGAMVLESTEIIPIEAVQRRNE